MVSYNDGGSWKNGIWWKRNAGSWKQKYPLDCQIFARYLNGSCCFYRRKNRVIYTRKSTDLAFTICCRVAPVTQTYRAWLRSRITGIFSTNTASEHMQFSLRVIDSICLKSCCLRDRTKNSRRDVCRSMRNVKTMLRM